MGRLCRDRTAELDLSVPCTRQNRVTLYKATSGEGPLSCLLPLDRIADAGKPHAVCICSAHVRILGAVAEYCGPVVQHWETSTVLLCAKRGTRSLELTDVHYYAGKVDTTWCQLGATLVEHSSK